MLSTNGRRAARLRNRSIETSQFEDVEANSRINTTEIESKHSISAHCWVSNSQPHFSTESKMKDIPSDTGDFNDAYSGYENEVLSKQNDQCDSNRNIKISQRTAGRAEDVCVFWDGGRQGSFEDHSRHLEIESFSYSYFESSQNCNLGSNSSPGPRLDCPLPGCPSKAEAGLDGVEALITHLEYTHREDRYREDSHRGQIDSGFVTLDHTQEALESTPPESSKYRLLPTPMASFCDAEADDVERRDEVDMADVASQSLAKQDFYDKVTSSGLVGASAISDTENDTSAVCEDSNHHSSSATDLSLQSSDCSSEIESCADSNAPESIQENDPKTRYLIRWLLYVANRYMMTFHLISRLDYSAYLRSCAYDSEPSSSPSTVAVSDTHRIAANSCQKRCRGETEEDEDNDDGSDDNPRKRSKPKSNSKEEGSSQLLSCFFWKHEPWKFNKVANIKYKICPNGFQGLQRVKEHCSRSHKAPIHCTRCKAEFKNKEDLKFHRNIQIEACMPNHEKQIEGITEDMTSDLRKATRQGKTEEEKWKLMYKILFPGESVPSPFNEISEAGSNFAREVMNFIPSYVEAGELDKFTDIQSQETELYLHSWLKVIGKDFLLKFGSHYQRVANKVQNGSSLPKNSLTMESYSDVRQARITSLQSQVQLFGTPDLTIPSSLETPQDNDSNEFSRGSRYSGFSVEQLQELLSQNKSYEGLNSPQRAHGGITSSTDIELRTEQDIQDPLSVPSTCPDYPNSSAGISYLQNDTLYPEDQDDLTAFMNMSSEDFSRAEPFPGTIMTEDSVYSFETLE